MPTLKYSSLVFMAAFYVFAGLMHFLKPKMYLKIMPAYLPSPLLLVYLSGIAELILGICLFIPSLTPRAAWGVIALLVAVFPANVTMFQNRNKQKSLTGWILLLRLPLQGVLILWAYWYT